MANSTGYANSATMAQSMHPSKANEAADDFSKLRTVDDVRYITIPSFHSQYGGCSRVIAYAHLCRHYWHAHLLSAAELCMSVLVMSNLYLSVRSSMCSTART